MSHNSSQQMFKKAGWVIAYLLLSACSQTEEKNSGTLEVTDETMRFVESYYANRSTNGLAARGVPLQMSARVGSASDSDICQTGSLYGPFTVTDGVLESDSSTATADQPSLRLSSFGDLAVCMIITSPVNATLDLTASTLSVDTSECEETPQYIGGVWQGDYSCTSGCGNESGTVRLTLLQDEFGASYTDGDANFEGTVCGNTFEFSGSGEGYTESGTFILNSNGSASKTSSYKNTSGDCTGTCSDPVLLRIYSPALYDDFDNEAFDPAWITSAQNTNNDVEGWNLAETGTRLVISDVTPQVVHDESGMEHSRIQLARGFTAMSDFIVEFNLDWESDDNTAMQSIEVELFTDDNSARIAYAGYSDAWVGSSGQQSTGIGASSFATGLGTLPNNGSASIKIVREAGNVKITWDGVEIQQGVATGNLGNLLISFGHYPFNNGLGSVSSLGTISLDKIRITGIPVI